MTLNLTAIFGLDYIAPETMAVIMPFATPDPICASEPIATRPVGKPWPIVPGTEHWNPYIPGVAEGPWGEEFIPGRHVEFRQPSTLQGLCSHRVGLGGCAARDALEQFETERRSIADEPHAPF